MKTTLAEFLRKIKATITDDQNAERFIITIVDDRGSRQFSVHREIKKIALFLGVAVGVVVIAWFVATHFLFAELEKIAKNKSQIQKNFIETHQTNEQYSKEIAQKIAELDLVNSKINTLESMLEIQRHAYDSAAPSAEVDFSAIDETQKMLILSIIPNGESAPTHTAREVPVRHQSGKDVAGGLLMSAPEPMEVVATADGIVEQIVRKKSRNYGNYVKLKHSFGFTSMYGFMGEILVKEGDFVSKGQRLGMSAAVDDANVDSGADSSAFNASNASSARYQSYYEARFLNLYLDVELYRKWGKEGDFALVADDKSGVNWSELISVLDGLRILKNYMDENK